jgi:hypothetical protein
MSGAGITGAAGVGGNTLAPSFNTTINSDLDAEAFYFRVREVLERMGRDSE